MVFAFDPVALQLPTGFLQVVPMAHKVWIMAFQLVVLFDPLHRVDVESDQKNQIKTGMFLKSLQNSRLLAD